MFTFQMDDIPEQVLDIEKSSITLFYNALTEDDQIALDVRVTANSKTVELAEDDTYSMAPTFYTEWLDIPLRALRSRGPDALHDYEMFYDQQREKELGFNQFPGAIYQDSHAGFTQAEMRLSHLDHNRYRVFAKGETEFGWRFELETQASLERIMFRDGHADSDKAIDPAIAAEFERLFDASQFDASWKKQGNPNFSWHDYIATPKAIRT